MTELKVYYCHLLHNEYTEFYSKSEADNEKQQRIKRNGRKGK